MAISDEWNVDFINKVISHIDGDLDDNFMLAHDKNTYAIWGATTSYLFNTFLS